MMLLLNIEKGVNPLVEYENFHGVSYKFNYAKLRGRIIEYFGKQALFALAMGLSERTLSLKLNNIRCWTQIDIYKACALLQLSFSEIPNYFFVRDTQD